MKRWISGVLALCLVMVLAACSKSETSNGGTIAETTAATTTMTTAVSETFVKPESYATVILVTINPQFRLYVDANGVVLAVEPVNEDAQSICDELDFENKTYETVVEKIVTASKEEGFIQDEATVNVEIVESDVTAEENDEILENTEQAVTETAEVLQVTIQVNVSVSDEVTGATATTVATTTTTVTTQTPTTVHTHRYGAADCTTPATCSCGATKGAALGHAYTDGVCTRCGAKDANYKPTSVLTKQGRWVLECLSNKYYYRVTLTLCKADDNGFGYACGEPVSELPEDMQNEPAIKSDCATYQGVEYFLGMGDGAPMNVSEDGNTVTLLDSSTGNKLVFTRTGENTLTCQEATGSAFTGNCAVCFQKGAVYTFSRA